MQLNPWVLFPLYLYPAPKAWDPLFKQIDANPHVNFQIIINPNSGPGGPPGSYPDTNWINAISKLNEKKNTQLLGYTHVEYGDRNMSDVRLDVKTYAAWSKHKPKNIRLDGLFIDETPAQNTASLVNYMSKIASFSRETFKDHPVSKVVFNPGTPVAPIYYDMADMIVAYEGYETTFSTKESSYPMGQIDAKNQKKSAIIIQGYSSTPFKQAKMVRELAEDNIQAMYISSTESYNKFSTWWPQLVQQIGALSYSNLTVAGNYTATANASTATTLAMVVKASTKASSSTTKKVSFTLATTKTSIILSTIKTSTSPPTSKASKTSSRSTITSKTASISATTSKAASKSAITKASALLPTTRAF